MSGSALRSVIWGWGPGGYLADRYVTIIFFFICLVLSLLTEGLVQNFGWEDGWMDGYFILQYNTYNVHIMQ